MSENQTHHLADVHRLSEGDACYVLDGSGQMAKAVIIRFESSGQAVLRIEETAKRSAFFPLKLKMYVAVPKRYKLDALVEKAQELGVEEFRPIESKRTVVKMAKETHAKVLGRWQRIAKEAAKQSYSLQLIKTFAPIKFAKALKEIPDEEVIAFFHPSENALSFAEFYTELRKKMNEEELPGVALPVNIFIGPEGGFTDEEEAMMEARKNTRKINLGDTVLKVDTAFYGIASSLRFLFAE